MEEWDPTTCDMCRWKVEKGICPDNYEYEGTDYAEDCIDFRHIELPETRFNEEDIQ